MPAGHTDRATINERKPLTPGMRLLLKLAVRDGMISGHRFTKGEQNSARGLMDRGLALPDDAGWWRPTEAGKAAVERVL